jgi:hypothetical protein
MHFTTPLRLEPLLMNDIQPAHSAYPVIEELELTVLMSLSQITAVAMALRLLPKVWVLESSMCRGAGTVQP